MFATFQQKLLLGIYIFILLSIPTGAYLISQQTTIKSRASETKTVKKPAKVTPPPIVSPAEELLESAQTDVMSQPTSSPAPSSSPAETTIATSYGPTLSLTVTLEGRPKGNQAGKLFVGIADGTLSINPKFLLSFTVDVPASGQYANLSLAGLNPGSTYTALLKGPAQIAAAKTFAMSPAATNLNSGEAVNLISGDLNEDNVVNSADYTIAQKAAGSTPKSAGWNENADLNKDGVINAFDLGIIIKNIGQVGVSGAWTSPIPKNATASASLSTGASAGLADQPVGTPNRESGYWIWVPK